MSEPADDQKEQADDRVDVEERRLKLIEQEPIVRLFSSPANVRMLTVLVDSANDLTASAIARQAGVSRSTWYDNRDLLIDFGLVKKTRESAGATHYQFGDSEQADRFVELMDAVRPLTQE